VKALIAIASFKGSIPSIEGSKAIANAIKEVYEDAAIVTLPLADGGKGLSMHWYKQKPAD
jgi:glycerate 2-kinase